MGLAFWRKADSPAAPPTSRKTEDRADPSTALRVRARRRLIGAAALLLAAVIVIPMVLDPAPRPVPDNIPIDIPSEKAPFAPRTLPPPLPEPFAPAPAADKDAGVRTPDPALTSAEQPAASAKSAPTAESEAPSAEPARVPLREAQAQKAEPQKAGRFVLQAAAFASDKPARELADRLKKDGMNAYVERVETREGARYRVRVGPFVSRGEAESARARLAILGVSANVLEL
jgi:DedD protein